MGDSQFYKQYESIVNGKKIKELSITAGRLGAPTSPANAKQLEEFGKLLNQGIKNVEIGTMSADKFEYIPKQHLEEIKRLSKLTESKISLHGPLIDLAGFPGQDQRTWSEDQRKVSEEQLYSILKRSFQLTDTSSQNTNKEVIPVVFHASNFPSQEFEFGKRMILRDENGKPIPDPKTHGYQEDPDSSKKMGYRSIVAVNSDSGEIRPIEWDEKTMLNDDGTTREEIFDPFRKLDSLNKTYWDQEKLKIQSRQKTIEELKEKMMLKFKQNQTMEQTGLLNNKEYQENYEQNKRDIGWMSSYIENEFSSIHSEYQDLFHRFNKFGNTEEKESFHKKFEEIKEDTKHWGEKEHEYASRAFQVGRMLENEEDNGKRFELEKIRNDAEINKIIASSEKAKEILNILSQVDNPNIWRPVAEFAKEKTAQTVSNAMSKLYLDLKKEGKEDFTPFIALENFFVNTPMSTAKELREVIENSRELLKKKLMGKEGNLTEEKAESVAEKLIGATWDVGHINNLRKSGLSEEQVKEKVLQESGNIAKYIKHVHLTDNFGFHDSHLAPGMGNVPIREIMEKLEKHWAELEDQGRLGQAPRAIVEAGASVGELGIIPTIPSLEYFDSPLYKLSNSPYWGPERVSIANSYSPYFESHIDFPQQHFNMYSSSFTTLPKSVGGQVGNDTSRFSGTPNQ